MNALVHAWNEAMSVSAGNFAEASRALAHNIQDDEELCMEAGTALIALLLQPAQAEHARIFEMANGMTLEVFVERFTPEVV